MKYTKFTNIEAENIKGNLEGLKNSDCVTVEMSADASLTDAQKNYLGVAFTCSAASKALTLGVKEGQLMFVANVGGTNAVTVKAISGDSGTSVGAGKVAMVIGSETANASKIYVLN